MATDHDVALRVENLWKVFAPGGMRKEALKNELKRDEVDADRIAQFERSGAVVAVRDVSFAVDPGEFFVVMGLSGSGKSSLIRCLVRLVEPTAGRIYCGEDEVTALGPRELTEFRRHKVAMVFQHYGLLPHRTVLDNVAFGLKLRGVPREERYVRAYGSVGTGRTGRLGSQVPVGTQRRHAAASRHRPGFGQRPAGHAVG